ncbi:helix-turn-helix domain-containing protein [Rudanella paleaurantiibacter]|uniref:Helix-turn-helix domain-containing protein n=1 Tax=Rudanella paleaurantiibacter TaxID=2614655 RepID=A0A7J5U1S3_9BACT|nr:helix-turn-helix transcriptional regulator [Rudanella paleaurantiibacter]KAB7731621.1 helix-turn-helix domain-containing protein [Rudanella paleaurantiibacter]
MHTGEKIRKLRELKDMKQDIMADRLGISRPAYSDIERGKTQVSNARLKQIADILEVKPEDILSFGEKVANFFEQCNGAVDINTGQQINHFDQRELQYQLEKAQLEMDKLRLEAEKYKAERDKAELEAQLLRNRAA